MTDIEFMTLAEAALRSIELNCDRLNEQTEADLDNQRVGGMVTITFDNGSQIIANLQRPLHEIWVAARSGGYHFKHDGQVWRDTKTGQELFERLTLDASVQSGMALRLDP